MQNIGHRLSCWMRFKKIEQYEIVMQILLILLAALAPVAILLWYIYFKDSLQPEPTRLLIKAFWFGVLSVFVVFVTVFPLQLLTGFGLDESETISDAFVNAFCTAAIPEEAAKLIVLWLFLRKNPYFDEHFDGIVYAVCIGMGFAAFENILYLFQSYDSWIPVAIVRALFAVPGHFLYAVIMGYYYSLWYFRIKRNWQTFIMILLGPILAHGIYDGILFSMDLDESLSVVLFFPFLFFFNKLRKIGKKHIAELANK